MRGKRGEYKKAYVEEVKGHELMSERYEKQNADLRREIETLRLGVAEVDKARNEEGRGDIVTLWRLRRFIDKSLR